MTTITSSLRPKTIRAGQGSLGTALTGVTLALGLLGPTSVEATTFAYGINDTGKIVEVNTATRTATEFFDTGYTGAAASNAVALNDDASRLFYRINNNIAPPGLYALDLASRTQIGLTLGSGVTPPTGWFDNPISSATWYNGKYWYFNDQSNSSTTATLWSASISGNEITAVDKYEFDTSLNTPNQGYLRFGDIAVNRTGTLYGATVGGNLFSVDLTTLLPTGNLIAQAATAPGMSLQIGFDETGVSFLAQAYGTGQWYSLTTAGVLTELTGFVQPAGLALRDIATTPFGNDTVLPLPSTAGLLAIAALGAALSSRRAVRISTQSAD